MTYSLKTVAAAVAIGLASLGAAGVAVRHAFADAAESAPAPAAKLERPQFAPPLPKGGGQAVRADDEKKADPKANVERVRATIRAVDADKKTIRVRFEEGGGEGDVGVPPETKVLFGKKAVALADLKPGMWVDLSFAGTSNTPVEVAAGWPRSRAEVRAADPAKNTITIRVENDGIDLDAVLNLAAGAPVTVDRLPAALADVPPGREVALELGLDKKTVTGVEADGGEGDVPALVKGYDAAAGTLTVEFDAEANDVSRRVALALPVAAGAKVRLAGKDAGLADLKPRMPVRLRMTADRRAVAGVLAGEPLPVEKDDD